MDRTLGREIVTGMAYIALTIGDIGASRGAMSVNLVDPFRRVG